MNESIGIDTEVMIALKDSFYDSWYGIGRFGLVFLKWITDTMTFQPYLTGIGVLLLLPIASMLWIWLFDTMLGRNNKIGAFFFSLILISSTIMTEQLYFKLQALEICIGLCLLPVSIYLVYQVIYFETVSWKKWLKLLLAVGINMILFSLYQVLVPLYIATVMMCMYIYIFFGKGKEENVKELWKTAGIFAGIFFISFILNQLVVKLCFANGDDYLGTQIFWGTVGIGACIRQIFEHIKEIVFGTQIYYAKTFSVYVAVILGITIYTICTSDKKNEKATGRNVLGILCMTGFFIAPFYMTLLCGKAPVIRSQLVYPFILSFMAYMVFCLPVTKKSIHYVLVFLGLFTLFLQVKYTTLLNYSDKVRYESDVRIATQMMQQIDTLQGTQADCPVVFYGSHPAELNSSCIKGEVIGYSFFEWDTDVEPKGFFSTRRILSFMHTLGKTYPHPDKEQIEEAKKYIQEMPDWPANGSIVKKEKMIIVKLSNIE